MTVTVSVIIPAHNATATIARAIDSVLAQTHPPFEIVVVDDGSRDRTADVVAAYGPAVRLVRKPNGGPATARNLGARLARGEWLGLLDADDWWKPEKLAVQLARATDPSVALIHCLPDHRSDRVPDQLSFEQMWKRNWIVNSSVLIRRTVFEELGGFDEAPELISVEDHNLWLRIAASPWRIVTCQEVLMHYTRGIGISSNFEKFMAATLYNIDSLQERLALDPEVVRAQRDAVIASFAGQALFERDLATARRLYRQAFSANPSFRVAAYLAVSHLPRPILDLKRNATIRRPSQSSALSTPARPAPKQPVAGEQARMLIGTRSAAARIASQLQVAEALGRLTEPRLIITVDAEEEFDWKRPFSRDSTGVVAMRSQHLAHRVFERFGAVPTYMVDYPVATKPEGRDPLRDLFRSGLCDIGAQLHSWVTPPLVERVSQFNSFQKNLSGELEAAKIEMLTSEIENAFGVRPQMFRAGRYGVGSDTAPILRRLGYRVDSSVLPCWSFRDRGGPDFREHTAAPYWIDQERSLLELPISAATVGRASGVPARLASAVFGDVSDLVGLPSALARLGLLERIRLTPEGITLKEAKRLVRHMLAAGHKVFVMTYHSPSLEPGNTPYVRNQGDLDLFLTWIGEFLAFFTDEVKGKVSRWSEVYDWLKPASEDAKQPYLK